MDPKVIADEAMEDEEQKDFFKAYDNNNNKIPKLNIGEIEKDPKINVFEPLSSKNLEIEHNVFARLSQAKARSSFVSNNPLNTS